MKPSPSWNPLFVVASAFVLAMTANYVINPVLFQSPKSFIWQHSLAIPYELCLFMVSQFKHGAIDLWSHFDQINFSYPTVTVGYTSWTNMMVAGVYLLFSPFIKFPGEAFHSTFTIVYYGFCAIMRLFGGFLFVSLYSLNPWVIGLSLFYLNTICSIQNFLGFELNPIMSFLPFLFYLIVKILREHKLKHILYFLITYAVMFASTPLLALGYIYGSLHFMLSIAGVMFIKNRWKAKEAPSFKNLLQFSNLGKVFFTAVICLVIASPYLLMYPLTSDIMPSSQSDRMNDFFNWNDRFQRFERIDWSTFLHYSLSADNFFWQRWVYLGVSSFFLFFIGATLSRHKEKWLMIGTTILTLLFIASPAGPTNFFSAVTWYQVFTNPFSGLLRSLHMLSLILPTYYFPVVVLGLKTLLEEFPSEGFSSRPKTIGLITLFAFLALWTSQSEFPRGTMFMFLAAAALIWLLSKWGQRFLNRRHYSWTRPDHLTLGFILILFIFDLWVTRAYNLNDTFDKREVLPRSYDVAYGQTIVPDYQNPDLFPLRNHYSIIPMGEHRLERPQNYYGQLFGFTHYERFFHQPNIYAPRHKSFEKLYTDGDFPTYLSSSAPESRMIYDVPLAVSRRHLSFHDAMKWNIIPSVVVIDDEGLPKTDFTLTEPEVLDLANKAKEGPLPARPPRPLRQAFAWNFSFKDAKVVDEHEGLITYSIKLPDDFPAYFSTTSFTKDRDYFQLSSQGKPLTPVQGKPSEPGTFDVQNYQTRHLTILLKSDYPLAGATGKLTIWQPEEILGLWSQTNDNYGLRYDMKQDGWLVIHTPWDDKMKISVDGQEVTKFRANEIFTAIPLASGQHDILLSYLPGSPIRLLLVISMVLGIVSAGGVFIDEFVSMLRQFRSVH